MRKRRFEEVKCFVQGAVHRTPNPKVCFFSCTTAFQGLAVHGTFYSLRYFCLIKENKIPLIINL